MNPIASAIPAEPADEARLIAESQRGDAAAFSRLVFVHQGRVRAYIGGSIWRSDVVDDLAQEVFLSAFRSLDTFKGDAPLGVWLLGIARNKLLMHLRTEGRRHNRETGFLDAVLAPWRTRRAEADETDLAQRELEIAALQSCLEGLPAHSAAIVLDHYFKARSIVDISKELGKREGSVRMTLLRVRQALRDCVRQRLDGEVAT